MELKFSVPVVLQVVREELREERRLNELQWSILRKLRILVKSVHKRVACLVSTNLVFPVMSRAAVAQDSTIARTIRFPAALRDMLAADADRCGRSFEGQVIALLRRHNGEDVDIAPGPADILALASASLANVPASDLRLLTRRLSPA
jgi:hypothetical protein